MEVNYELKAEDFVQLGKELEEPKKQSEPLIVILVITYFLFILADIIFALVFGTLNDWNLSQILGNLFLRTVVLFAVVLCSLGIIKLIIRQKISAVKNEPPNGLLCEHRVVINENELIEITDLNTSRFAWKAIGEIKETESFVMINILLSGSFIIPKRSFHNQNQLNEFVEMAKYYQINSDNHFQLSHLIQYEKSLED